MYRFIFHPQASPTRELHGKDEAVQATAFSDTSRQPHHRRVIVRAGWADDYRGERPEGQWCVYTLFANVDVTVGGIAASKSIFYICKFPFAISTPTQSLNFPMTCSIPIWAQSDIIQFCARELGRQSLFNIKSIRYEEEDVRQISSVEFLF